MAVPRWNEIVATEEWQGLDDRGKAQVKQRYLSEVGQTPEWQGLAPEQKQRVLTVMDEQGGLSPKIEEPSLLPASFGEAAGNVADYYRGVPGQVAGAVGKLNQAVGTPALTTPEILDPQPREIVRRPPELQRSHPTEAERQREVMGVVPPGESPYLTPEQAAQAGRDLAATAAKMAMGVSKGLTLGAVDVEKGTVGVPFGGKRYQLGPDVRKSLADLGVSPETAGSGLPGAVGDFAGIAGPWGATAKVFRAGVQGLRGGEAAGTVGRMAETAAAEGLTGATVAAAHEPSPESMTVGGILAAAASTGIDAVRLRKELLTGIKGSDWWRLRTNKERALTVQNFDNMTVDDLRAAGLSEAVMARKYPQVFERLNRVRGFGSAAEVPRPSHADPAANAPRADAELAIQKADPAAKPVVEIPAGQYPEVKALIPAKSSTVKVGKNIYAFDLPTLKALLRRDSLSEVKKALTERIAAGRYGDLLGYGSAVTPEQGAVDVAVTRDGEVVTDLPAMKAAEEAGKIAVAGSLKEEEAPEIAGRWQGATLRQRIAAAKTLEEIGQIENDLLQAFDLPPGEKYEIGETVLPQRREAIITETRAARAAELEKERQAADAIRQQKVAEREAAQRDAFQATHTVEGAPVQVLEVNGQGIVTYLDAAGKKSFTHRVMLRDLEGQKVAAPEPAPEPEPEPEQGETRRGKWAEEPEGYAFKYKNYRLVGETNEKKGIITWRIYGPDGKKVRPGDYAEFDRAAIIAETEADRFPEEVAREKFRTNPAPSLPKVPGKPGSRPSKVALVKKLAEYAGQRALVHAKNTGTPLENFTDAKELKAVLREVWRGAEGWLQAVNPFGFEQIEKAAIRKAQEYAQAGRDYLEEAPEPETPAEVVEEAVQTAQEKGLPLKQQKAYLLENIEEAIKAAPDALPEPVQAARNEYLEVQRWLEKSHYPKAEDFQRRTAAKEALDRAEAEHGGKVEIHVPGDGTFSVWNTRETLSAFRDRVKKEFPATEKPAKPPAYPSGKATGVKATGLEGYFEVTGGPEPWHSNGHIMLKGAPAIAPKSRRLDGAGQDTPLEYGFAMKAVPRDLKGRSKATETEFLAWEPGEAKGNAEVQAASSEPIRLTDRKGAAQVRLSAPDGQEVYLRQDYYLYARQHYPQAEFWLRGTLDPIAIVDKGEIVGAAMPLRYAAKEVENLRAPASSGASASAGSYAGAKNAAGLEPPPGTSPEDLAGAARTARAQTAKAMAMPEIVELAKALAGGKLPLLQKQLMRNPGVLGLFSHDGHIELKKAIFRDPHVAAAVLAHEVGHFADWLPDRYMKRGNILGRIATLRGYMKSLLEEFPGAKGKTLTDADRDRLRKEARRLLREEWQKGIREIIEIVVREEPIFEQSGITPEMVMDIWNGMTARETNPALYDFLARLSGAEKAAIVRQAMKGIVDAALQKLAGVRQVGTRTVRETIKRTVTPPEVTPQSIAKKFKELLAEEIHKRRLWEAEQITEELKTLTMRWNPFDPAQDPKFTKYRFSSVELYAEALSVLMNDPALLREIAPKFNQAFFNYLDRKPAFRDTWEEIQRRLGDETALWDSRFERLDAMFSHGEEGFSEKRQYVGEPWPRRLKIELVDQHAAVLDRLPGNAEVRQAIEDYIYRSAEAEYLFKELAEKVLSPLKESGIGYDWLKRYVFLRRVAGDRSKIANPGGITPLEVPGGLREIERRLGPEKFRLLEESERLFQQVWKKDVVDELVKADIYGPELLAKITSNQTYYTFAPVEYLTKRYGSGVSSMIHAQAGTLEDIADPVVATIIKGMSLLANARRMQAIRAAGKALAQAHPREAYFPGEEDLYFDKNFMAKRAKEPRLRGQGIIRWLDKGEIREMYVPEAVAQTFEKNPVEGLLVTRIISGMTRPFRELFVNKRVGFSVFNIQRDPRSAVKALPKATMLFPGLNGKHPLMPHLLRELPNAFRGVRGYDPHTQELLRNRALIPSVDRTGMTTEDTELERLLLEHGFELPREVRMKNAGPVGRWIDRHPRLTRAAEAKALQLVYRSWNGLMRWLNILAATGERTTKLGADSYLRQHFPQMSPAERAAIVRHIGSPAFLVKGRLNPIVNNLHLFFNPFVQGWRTQGRAVRGDFRAPGQSARQARLEYLWKSVKMDILPKFLMWGASLGVGGVALRELYLRVSDYNKTNYIIVPLGRTKTGKAVALRLPQDEAGRMTTGLLWKLLNNVDSVDDLFSLLDYAADQAPGMNPVLSMLWDLGDFMSGRNPYDRFRGMPAIPDKIFAAQDSRRVEAFLKYLSNKAGGGIVYTFQTDEVEKIKNELETVLGAPVIGDVLGRLIIVQDTGLRQDLAQGLREKVEVPKARELLDADEALAKLVNNDPDFSKNDLETLIRHPRGIDDKLTRMIARRHGMAYLEALVRAKSVEERAYIIQHMLEHTPKPEKE